MGTVHYLSPQMAQYNDCKNFEPVVLVEALKRTLDGDLMGQALDCLLSISHEGATDESFQVAENLRDIAGKICDQIDAKQNDPTL